MLQKVANTPEVRDDQEFFDVVGPLCAAAGCSCNMRKLSDALCERSFPAMVAVAAGPAVVEAEEAHPQPVVPDVVEAGEAHPQPVVPEAVARDDEAVAEADPFHAEARLEALHSASGQRCSCSLCQAAKERRDFSESLSHPHNEQACQQTPGLHSFNDLPTYI